MLLVFLAPFKAPVAKHSAEKSVTPSARITNGRLLMSPLKRFKGFEHVFPVL